MQGCPMVSLFSCFWLRKNNLRKYGEREGGRERGGGSLRLSDSSEIDMSLPRRLTHPST
jgi:hypothetical protein